MTWGLVGRTLAFRFCDTDGNSRNSTQNTMANSATIATQAAASGQTILERLRGSSGESIITKAIIRKANGDVTNDSLKMNAEKDVGIADS